MISDPMTEHKIILVTRKTRLEDLIIRYNTIQQAQFYIEHMGNDFSDYLKEDQTYHEAVSRIMEELPEIGRVQIVQREYLSNFIFGPNDIIVAVGQDGLVANVMKYLDSQPLIGINPDAARWDGVLLPFGPADAGKIVQEVVRNIRKYHEVTLAQAQLNDGQKLYAVNDLFIGQRTHTSARYTLTVNDKAEQQSSSGIIVSTGLGSTGWLKSIITGANGIAAAAQGNTKRPGYKPMQWNADYLYYSVREPYPSKWTGADLVFGKIDARNRFQVISQMPSNGVIFSDGLENDYLEFNSGMEANVTIADKRGHLVV